MTCRAREALGQNVWNEGCLKVSEWFISLDTSIPVPSLTWVHRLKEREVNWDHSHTENLCFKWVCTLISGLSKLASHSFSLFRDQFLRPFDTFHAPTETMIQIDDRWQLWSPQTLGLWPFRKEPLASWRDQESQLSIGDLAGGGLWPKHQ